MIRIFKIWLKMAEMVVLPDLAEPSAVLVFALGKIVRFFLYFWFIFTVSSFVDGIGGYTASEVVIFFLVFTIIDSTTQLFFRGVYQFRPLVVSGNFDLDLLKPWPSFFRPVFGRFDLADFITLFPFFGFFVWFLVKNSLILNIFNLPLFLGALLTAYLFSFSFHLFVCSFCILTMEIDHLIWVYRDLSSLARFPDSVYRGLFRFLITFVVPIILMFSFPARALLGKISLVAILVSFLGGIFLTLLSLKFWYWSLKRYTSASS